MLATSASYFGSPEKFENMANPYFENINHLQNLEHISLVAPGISVNPWVLDNLCMVNFAPVWGGGKKIIKPGEFILLGRRGPNLAQTVTCSRMLYFIFLI